MTGDEVEALLGLAFLVAVDLGAAEEPWRPSGGRAALTARMVWCAVRVSNPDLLIKRTRPS